ncbi:YihY/virulence factor BrkB family protein [Ramlibacter sp. AW1]|uniref:YihY/virulence factor BrkB family protein n=1 Tax=Ramlibacter aurantiacus TaxID=2801330 RepID=A0A936ZGK3_9BURK|nr:YihY/virulence factor BrkB family protein [Ramlibacter aurantiacus]MBL0419477.1 YihY/virulence factor BrkB family protein [Ramlibacter aurantiacus]
MLTPRRVLRLFTKAATEWSNDYAFSMSAAISYYTVFSLAPLLLIVIAVAGALFGREAVQGEIVSQIDDLVGRQGAEFVQVLLARTNESGSSGLAAAIGFVVLLVGATTVFAELQSSLDRIWKVPEREKPAGIWGIVRARLLSFGLIVGVAFLMMVSLVVSAGVAALNSWAGGLLPGWEKLLWTINALVSLGIFTVLFAMIFKVLPSTPIALKDVWVGSLVTAVLFELGKFAISLYLGRSGVTETFQAAGALVVLLAWVYYASLIFLFGAEFTKAYANDHGSRSSPQEKAARRRSDREAVVQEVKAQEREAQARVANAEPEQGGPNEGSPVRSP